MNHLKNDINVITGYEKGGPYHKRLRSPNGSNLYICADLQGVIGFLEGPVVHYLGYKNEQLMGQKLASYILQEDLIAYSSLFDNHNDRAEFRIIRADGSLFYGEVFVYDVYDEKGEHSGYCFRMYDITSRMNEIFRLMEQDDRFNAIVDKTRDLILIFKGREILYANEIVLHKLGYTMQELMSKDYYQLYSENDRERIEEFDFVLRDKQTMSWSFEASVIHTTGDKLQCEIDIKSIHYKGQPAFLALFHDVTAYKKATQELISARHEAESANRIKSDFLAMMSHEIRTPMNGVIGMTGLLLNTELTEQQRDYTETIKVSGDVLVDIINDILDFTKIESGRLELEESPFELQTCIEETLDLLALKAMEKGLDLLYLIEPDVSPVLLGDSGRLRQILVNLVGNAIKFTAKGEVFISVQHIRETEGHVELRFSVRDTGIGIDSSRLPYIFEAFTQADTSTTRKYGGTGLGLAITRRLVNLMDGDVWAESELYKGSVFYFIIRVKNTSEVKPTMYIKGNLLKLIGKTVLIVDDNQTNLQILKFHFESWGMKPLLANSGERAIKLVSSMVDLPVIAVFDMQMPVMDGIQLAQKFKSNRLLSKIPLILLSSTGDMETIPHDLFVSRLSKPIRLKSLFNEVEIVISDLTRKTRMEEAAFILDQGLGKRLPLRILIAEDNLVNQKLTISLLKLMGYRVDAVINGKEVLEILEEKDFDIILMDIQMPEMNGIEATEKIMETIPLEKQPLVIALTANAMAGDRENCLEAGMVDYMAKPVKINELQKMIEKWGEVIHAKGSDAD